MKGKFVVCSRRSKNVAGGSCTHASENFSRCSCAAHVKEIYEQELYGVKDHSTASAEFLFCLETDSFLPSRCDLCRVCR